MADRTDRPISGEELVKQDLITREELARAREREAATGTPWYRQLLQMGKISFGAVEDVLTHEFHPKSLRQEHETLGETLVKMGAISREKLNTALAEQNRTGRLLGNILLDQRFATRETIAKALSKQHGLEFAELVKMPSDPSALEAVPESIARKKKMIPVRLEGDRLTVLIGNPQDKDTLNDIGILLGKRIYPVLTATDNIVAEITTRYRNMKTRGVQKSAPAQKSSAAQKTVMPQKLSTPAKPGATKATTSSASEKASKTKEKAQMKTGQTKEVSRLEEVAQEASGMPVIKLVNTILEGAVNAGATDIHLDPQEPEMRVRYRIDGILHDVMTIPPDIENAVVSRVKIMCDMDITETRRPQDGHMDLAVSDMEYDVRVATLPVFLGERIVLRLLDQSSVLSGIKDLGLEPEDEKAMERMVKQPYGMILVTGPTGSGKTTSLYAALNQKNVITDSIVTLEDPVEYQLSGINQVQIDTDIDMTFANTLRASLRQDIDVLLVGEVRDPETARIAVRAAMTGHLVFSTLHTNDAPEAIMTLRNMGVPSYLIASALTAVIGQRLVRKICPNCKTAFKSTKQMLKALGLPDTVKELYHGVGCDQCYHTGCKGRTGIFEILEVTPAIRKMIAAEEPIEKITTAAKLKTMADRCKLKVKEGIVAPDEFFRVIRI